jgi:hypothetical protein
MFHKRLPLTKYNNENTSNERKIKNQNCKIKNGSPVLARILQNKTVGGPSAISQATDQPQEKIALHYSTETLEIPSTI